MILMIKRLLKVLAFLFLPFSILIFGFWIYLHTALTPRSQQVTIEKGASLKKISETLSGRGIIRYPYLFMLYVQMTRNGRGLKAGDYLFDKPVTPREVLAAIRVGKVVPLVVRILEGWNLEQLATHLETLRSIKDPQFKEKFLYLAQDSNFIASLGLKAPSLEGYLFPDTYHFSQEMTPEEYLRTIAQEFKKKYTEASATVTALIPLTQHEIVTLASMIEKETGKDFERPVIASVFYNRLAKKMLLQSDPTTIYGIKNFDGNLKKEDLNNPHTYNTYVHAGLPPGPICNPGLASLKAALNPAKTDYFYFVSKKNGTHYFSKTQEEHAAAVQKFQLEKGSQTPSLQGGSL